MSISRPFKIISAASCTIVLILTAIPAIAYAQADQHAETIDTFARHHLYRQQNGADQSPPLELLLIQGAEKKRSAYIIFDGRYGKSVRQGDRVDDWTVARISVDSVELKRSGHTETLRLKTDIGTAPDHATQR